MNNKEKRYYPILVDLEGKNVIVVGGGLVARRKVETLLEYGAKVHIVSKTLVPELRDHVIQNKVLHLGKEFKDEFLDEVFMVIAATDDHLLNHRVSHKAKERGVLINAVDQPEDCTFIVPSILKRGDLLIAVSTSGKSPAMAKKVREALERKFGDEHGAFLRLMGHIRREILERGLSQRENQQLFQALVNSDLLDLIGRKAWDEVADRINGILLTELSPSDILTYLKVD
jgi:precorrin-2 dehydrogenase/sirohydrochlorin ferrochelatase